MSGANQHVAIFENDDAGYLDWLAKNEGWVVNAPRSLNPNELILHATRCYTITGRPAGGENWTDQYVKVCSIRLSALHKWAREDAGGRLRKCAECEPEG